MEDASLVPLVMGGVIALGLLALVIAAKNFIVLVRPNMVAVITGRRAGGDSSLNYRFVSGGRTFRIPIVQDVSFLPLTTMSIPVDVKDAPSKGYIPLHVRAIANVKIASTPAEALHAAAERLLGMRMEEMSRLAEETLTANLRGVLSRMTPEEVNYDREAFEREIASEAKHELLKLGFSLDNFKIQQISDNAGYLEAVGKVKTAEVVKNAAVAQAIQQSETQQQEAEARRAAEVARAEAGLAIAEAQNLLRVRQAELNREAETAERTAAVMAHKAEVVAQQDLEEQRIGLQRKRLQADIVEPAEAHRKQAEQLAAAEAAPIRESGRAQAEVLELLLKQIQVGGNDGMRVFLAEKLTEMLPVVVATVKDIDVERLVIVDGGAGGGVASAANQKALAAYTVMEGLASRLGLDIESVMQGVVGQRAAGLLGGEAPTAVHGDPTSRRS